MFGWNKDTVRGWILVTLRRSVHEFLLWVLHCTWWKFHHWLLDELKALYVGEFTMRIWRSVHGYLVMGITLCVERFNHCLNVYRWDNVTVRGWSFSDLGRFTWVSGWSNPTIWRSVLIVRVCMCLGGKASFYVGELSLQHDELYMGVWVIHNCPVRGEVSSLYMGGGMTWLLHQFKWTYRCTWESVCPLSHCIHLELLYILYVGG